MKINYENTMNDLVQANLHYYATSPTLKNELRRQRLVWSLILFGSVMVFYSVSHIPLLISLPVALALTGFYNFRTLRGFNKRVTKLTEKLYREGENKGAIGPRELEATPEGLISRTAYSEAKYSWAMLERIDSTADHTYLYVGAASALIVPHDRITSGNFRAFMQEIGKHYHPDKKLESQPEGLKLER